VKNKCEQGYLGCTGKADRFCIHPFFDEGNDGKVQGPVHPSKEYWCDICIRAARIDNL